MSDLLAPSYAPAPCHLLASSQGYPECCPAELSAMTEIFHVSAPPCRSQEPDNTTEPLKQRQLVRLKTTLFIQFASRLCLLGRPVGLDLALLGCNSSSKKLRVTGTLGNHSYPFHFQDGEFEGQRVQGSQGPGVGSDRASPGEEGQGQERQNSAVLVPRRAALDAPAPPSSPTSNTHYCKEECGESCILESSSDESMWWMGKSATLAQNLAECSPPPLSWNYNYIDP